MRIAYLPDGTPMPVFEPGDLVRLIRDEPGDVVTARAGEWGEVLRNGGAEGLDIRFAGYSRPRTTDLPVALNVPSSRVVPCDRRGLRIELQRDFRQAARKG